MAAGSLASVPEGQGLPDLAQGEADGLGGADEAETGGGIFAVLPVPALPSGWVGHQSDPLVVADGRRFHS